MNSTTNNSMLPKGTLLHGSYHIDQYLASGGFGNTYAATNQFGEKVAIKEFFMRMISTRDEGTSTVSVSIADNRPKFDEQLAKFREEAKRLRGLNNRHIVRVHDLFDENGTAYYVMDYIEGGSLKDTVKNGGPLQETPALDIFSQLLDALEAVHNKGFYHLDIKPSNVMLRSDGTALLIDFGASKHMKAEGGATTDTAPACTPGYAPSELMEQSMNKVGPWTDLYSLGATLYYMVTTHEPPKISDLNEGPDEAFHFPVEVSQKVRELIVWMMSIAKNRRPQSVKEVRDWLSNYIEVAEPVTGGASDEGGGNIGEGGEDGGTVVLGDPGPMGSEPSITPVYEEEKPNNARWWIYLLIAFVVALGLSLFFIPRGCNSSSNVAPAAQADSASNVTAAHNLNYSLEGFGDCVYNGPVNSDNAPQGFGKATFSNGSSYEGDWVNGKMEGQGTFTYESGDVFVGTMANNAFKEGTITFASDGNYFTGPFVDGQPDYSKGHEYNKNGKRLK